MLISIAKLYSECGTTDLTALIDQKNSFSLEVWTWIDFSVALAIKTLCYLFIHGFPQKAHVQAPTAGSVILCCSLIKVRGDMVLCVSLFLCFQKPVNILLFCDDNKYNRYYLRFSCDFVQKT